MASSNCDSLEEEIYNYKKKLELLMRHSQEKIDLLKGQKESANKDTALNESIKELEDNVLAIKTALKDVEELESRVKLLTISSQILEDNKEMQEYKQEIHMLQDKKTALKKELSHSQEQCMNSSIMISELKDEIEQLSVVNICTVEEKKVENITGYISIGTQTQNENFEEERSDATTQTNNENFEEERSDATTQTNNENFEEETSDTKHSSQNVSSPK